MAADSQSQQFETHNHTLKHLTLHGISTYKGITYKIFEADIPVMLESMVMIMLMAMVGVEVVMSVIVIVAFLMVGGNSDGECWGAWWW